MLEDGQAISLGNVTYTDVKSLGQGAVSAVYRAQLGEYAVAIKLAAASTLTVDPASADTAPGSRESAGLLDEARVLKVLNVAEVTGWDPPLANQPATRTRASVEARIQGAMATRAQRLVVALYDDGTTENGDVYLVQELAPEQVRITQVRSLDDEWRTLTVLLRVAQAMALAHQYGFALQDFDPRTKLDRIRVHWLADSLQPEVLLIDWNITGDSSLFDRDLLYFGGHAYHLLIGRLPEYEADGSPPAKLGLGVAAWNALSEGSQQLLQRLLQRDAARRYRNAQAVVEDVEWIQRSINLARQPGKANDLRSLAYEARSKGRYDRLLAVTGLALALPLEASQHSVFETLRGMAQEETERDLWRPLAPARVSLFGGQFDQATAGFRRILTTQTLTDEQARLARYLLLQSEIGEALKKQVMNLVETPAWGDVQRAVTVMLAYDWEEAEAVLRRAAESYPRLVDLRAYRLLLALAQGGQAYNKAALLREQAQPPPADLPPVKWPAAEADKLATLEQAVILLQTAAEKAAAPEGYLREPFLSDALLADQRALARRRTIQELLAKAETLWGQGSYGDARPLLDAVLSIEKQHPRAAFLRRLIDDREAGARALARADYARAYELLERVAHALPGDEELQRIVLQAQIGASVQTSLARDLQAKMAEPGPQLTSDGMTPAVVRQANENVFEPWREFLSRVQKYAGFPLLAVARDEGLVVTDPASLRGLNFALSSRLSDQVTLFEARLIQTRGQFVDLGLQEVQRQFEALHLEDARRLTVELLPLADGDRQSRLERQRNRIQQTIVLPAEVNGRLAAIDQSQEAKQQAHELIAVLDFIEQQSPLPAACGAQTRSLRQAASDYLASGSSLLHLPETTWGALLPVRDRLLSALADVQAERQRVTSRLSLMTDRAAVADERRRAWNAVRDDTSVEAQGRRSESLTALRQMLTLEAEDDASTTLDLAREGDLVAARWGLRSSLLYDTASRLIRDAENLDTLRLVWAALKVGRLTETENLQRETDNVPVTEMAVTRTASDDREPESVVDEPIPPVMPATATDMPLAVDESYTHEQSSVPVPEQGELDDAAVRNRAGGDGYRSPSIEETEPVEKRPTLPQAEQTSAADPWGTMISRWPPLQDNPRVTGVPDNEPQAGLAEVQLPTAQEPLADVNIAQVPTPSVEASFETQDQTSDDRLAHIANDWLEGRDT